MNASFELLHGAALVFLNRVGEQSLPGVCQLPLKIWKRESNRVLVPLSCHLPGILFPAQPLFITLVFFP